MSCFLTPGFARSPKAIRLASADQVGPEVSPLPSGTGRTRLTKGKGEPSDQVGPEVSPLPFVSRVRPVPEADIVHNPPGATKAMRFPSGDQAVDSDASSNS